MATVSSLITQTRREECSHHRKEEVTMGQEALRHFGLCCDVGESLWHFNMKTHNKIHFAGTKMYSKEFSQMQISCVALNVKSLCTIKTNYIPVKLNMRMCIYIYDLLALKCSRAFLERSNQT